MDPRFLPSSLVEVYILQARSQDSIEGGSNVSSRVREKFARPRPLFWPRPLDRSLMRARFNEAAWFITLCCSTWSIL